MKNVAVPGALNLNDFRRMVMDNVVMNDYSSQFLLHECKPVDRALRLLDSGRFFDVDEGEENEIIVCCPAPDVWREFNRTGKIVETYGGNKIRLTKAYRREFEKCSSLEFVKLGDEAIKRFFDGEAKPLHKRDYFWKNTAKITVTTVFLIVSVFLGGWCYRRGRLRIKKNQNQMVVLLSGRGEGSQFYTDESNLLGQGGGGRVYEGQYDGIEVAIKRILEWDNQSRATSLRNECIIQHAFKHDYILDIFYPPLGALVQPHKRLETIVVAKYGWGGQNKRNLFDLLIEIKQKTASGEWDQSQANTVAWDVTKSLIKGLQNLHEARTAGSNGHNYASQFSSVVHRDIKLKNIGVKCNADGHFYAVIADFGLSSVLLKPDTRIRSDSWRSRIASIRVGRLPRWLEAGKYLVGLPTDVVDNQVLSLIKQCEDAAIRNFLLGCACGTDHWLAPEIDKQRRSSYYFALDDNYNCKRCFDKGSGRTYAGGFKRNDPCRECRERIFAFYRKNDIYSTGLVLWSILKAVIGSFSGFHTEKETGIASYLEHPLDVTTSHDCESSRSEMLVTQPSAAALLVAEVTRASRLAEINRIDDKRISMIRQLAELCLNPNPFERPEAAALYEEVEQLNINIEVAK